MLQPMFLPNVPNMGGTMGPAMGSMGLTFDGKRMRRSVQRKTVDYNAPICQYIEVCPDLNFIKRITSASTEDLSTCQALRIPPPLRDDCIRKV